MSILGSMKEGLRQVRSRAAGTGHYSDGGELSSPSDRALVFALLRGTTRSLLLAALLAALSTLFALTAPVPDAFLVHLLAYAAAAGKVLLIILASFLAGALPAFLFALPRFVPAVSIVAGKPENTAASGSGSPAGNLEEISDWLTKILLGAGLTQLSGLPARLWAWSGKVSDSAFGGPEFQALTLTLIVSGTLFGFLATYIVSRLILSNLLINQEGQARQFIQSALAPFREQPAPSGDTRDPWAESEPLGNAAEVAGIPLSELRTASDYYAWAVAQVQLGRLEEARNALEIARKKYPNDPQVLLLYSRVLQRERDFTGASQATSELKSLAPSKDSDLASALDIDQMFNLLYDEKNRGYLKAIEIGERLKHNPAVARQPRFWVYLAAANGQRHCHATDDEERRLARERALEAVRKATALDQAERAWLPVMRGMLDPQSNRGYPDEDDDLRDFRNDNEFREALGLAPAAQ